MLVSLTQADVVGKTVLVRVDFNVPLRNGNVLDDTRIRGAIPTLNYLRERSDRIIICSHLGRPDGKIVERLSLIPIKHYLENMLDEEITFINTWEEDALLQQLKEAETKIILLENTRYDPGEKSNSTEFSKLLSRLADIFVSDAFGAVHRAHASTVGVTRHIPGYAGLLVEKEVEKIIEIRDNPVSPSVALFGGAKISTKLEVLKNFIGKVDTIVLGGGMANTFLKAQGFEIGDSLYEEDMIDIAAEIIEQCKEKGVKLVIPQDVRVAKSFDSPWIEYGKAKLCAADDIPKKSVVLDIGEETEKEIIGLVQNAKSIIWNGPLGVFEKEYYSSGTLNTAKKVIERRVPTIVGGGETAYAMNLTSLEIPTMVHISTGGGASLELMAGKELPGLLCLTGQVRR